MKAVLQRVAFAKLSIDDKLFSYIDDGILLLLGIAEQDSPNDIALLCDKIVNLRIFEDENGKMNYSLLQQKKDIMIVSNFTLYADCKKGRRPSFINAAKPDFAKPLYEKFVNQVKSYDLRKVATGVFGSDMKIELLNDGPVTIVIDSKDLK